MLTRQGRSLPHAEPKPSSGYPHLEEAYWSAEGVLPLLRQKGVAAAISTLSS